MCIGQELAEMVKSGIADLVNIWGMFSACKQTADRPIINSVTVPSSGRGRGSIYVNRNDCNCCLALFCLQTNKIAVSLTVQQVYRTTSFRNVGKCNKTIQPWLSSVNVSTWLSCIILCMKVFTILRFVILNVLILF